MQLPFVESEHEPEAMFAKQPSSRLSMSQRLQQVQSKIVTCSWRHCTSRSGIAVKVSPVMGETKGEAWRANLIRDTAEIQQLALQAKRIAVLGIKTEDKADQPAYFVPAYLQAAGMEVVPVPVFYPDVTHILGQQVYRRVQDVPGQIDILDVFRKPSDIPPHLDDILAAKPKAVWLQSGITHPEAEEQLARAGIKVVSNRCIKVEHQQARMYSKI